MLANGLVSPWILHENNGCVQLMLVLVQVRYSIFWPVFSLSSIRVVGL